MPRRMDDLGGYKDADDPMPSAPGASGVIHSKEQEDDVRAKAASGQMIGQDSLDYLGHFANDDVTRKGHNVGHKPKGVAHFTGMAKKGFRRMAGNGATAIGAGKSFEKSMARDGMPMTPTDSAKAANRRPFGAKPPMSRAPAMALTVAVATPRRRKG